MTTYFKYFAVATFAMLLCSCDKEMTLDTVESQVQISANITPCVVTRVTDDGTAFSNGDAIKVQNINRESKNLATYTYSESTGKWSTTDELYWDGEAANTFNAWYPATAQYGSFTVPSDQSAGIAAADWMTATASAKKADGNVQLAFNHNLAKVTVVINSWSNEYAANEKIVNSLELNSLSSVMSYNGTLSGDNTAKWVKTYTSQANTSFVAIVAPTTYNADTDVMQIYVNGASTPLKVKTISSVVVESGKAYTFKLTVGKNLATISSSVTIGEWDDVVLDNQQAGVVTSQNKYIDEYGVNHGEGVEIDGVVWAPVNCGYHATDYPYGKLYQWGRKYGQGYDGSLYDSNFDEIGQFADASIPEKVQESLSLSDAQSKSNENVFFLGYVISNIYYDWVNPLDEVLWNSGTESSPIKNVENDPCPSGWRVPTCKELEGLTGNYSEWTENDKGQGGYWVCGACEYSSASPKIFLPAAGYRNSEGDADGRGYSANYWTSALFITNLEYEATPTTIYRPYNLGFRPVSTIAKYNDDRTNGYSVRCVKE